MLATYKGILLKVRSLSGECITACQSNNIHYSVFPKFVQLKFDQRGTFTFRELQIRIIRAKIFSKTLNWIRNKTHSITTIFYYLTYIKSQISATMHIYTCPLLA